MEKSYSSLENWQGQHRLRVCHSGNGTYDILKQTSLTFWDAIVAGKESSAIKPGNATNHLRADCSGNTLALYVNAQKLLETNDSDFKSGQVGMAVTTQPNSAPMDVHFDNFVVRAANGQTDLRRGVALHLGADDLGILECVKFRQK